LATDEGTNEQTDGQTNGQLENIMRLASLDWHMDTHSICSYIAFAYTPL